MSEAALPFSPADAPPGLLTGEEFLAKVAAGMPVKGLMLTEADLSGADLSGADLVGVMLHRVVLQKADFSNADLTGAAVIESDLSEAVLAGAKLVYHPGEPPTAPAVK